MFTVILICCITANVLAVIGAVGTFIYHMKGRK